MGSEIPEWNDRLEREAEREVCKGDGGINIDVCVSKSYYTYMHF